MITAKYMKTFVYKICISDKRKSGCANLQYHRSKEVNCENVSRNNRIKRVAPCRCLDGVVKEPYEMSMTLGARPYVQLPSSVRLHIYVPSHI